MTNAIAITRSQLRQVIEDYIAASRVGDTLSYVETAKLSTAEAAESSTARIWDGLEALVRNVSPAESPAEQALEQIEQVFSEPEEFTCAEDLAAGQVVIVNSRGMIEGKRDEADKIVMSEHPVVSYDFAFFQAEQLHTMFSNDTDAKVRVDFMPDGKVFAWDHSPDVAPIELTDTVGGEPEPESADDFF